MRPEITLEPFRISQVPLFLSLATREGWQCGQWEFDFLLENFPNGCWVACSKGDRAGFITGAKYGKSGWIGNLLVREDRRGQGIGRLLMEQAMNSLDRAGVETIWLTASRAGQPLYEKLGFVATDTIIRWRGKGTVDKRMVPQECPMALVAELDHLAWGDDRRAIIGNIAGFGTVVAAADGFCMVQGTDGALQLGPWSCRGVQAAEELLDQALAVAGRGTISLDVPESNHHASSILVARGFSPMGATRLMYRGSRPRYQPRYIYALASMGSMG